MLYSDEVPPLNRAILGIASEFQTSTQAYLSPWLNEAVMFRGMHGSALPLVLLTFGLIAGGLAGWTRLFWAGLPLSQRKGAAIRSSLVRLLASRALSGIVLSMLAWACPPVLGFFPSSLVGLVVLCGLDCFLIVGWYRGTLPNWSEDL